MKNKYEITRREFLRKVSLFSASLGLLGTTTINSTKGNIEEKAENFSPTKNSLKRKIPEFPETSWHMTMVAQCAGIGPYSFKSPYAYFELFKR